MGAAMAQGEIYDDLIAKLDMQRLPSHIAIIMDGNGRWAQSRHLPRNAGHKAGAEALRRAVELCREIGVPILTVYAFSTENWQRPAEEVGFLMRLFIQYLHNEVALMNEQEIRLGFLGDKSGLPREVQKALKDAQTATAANTKMLLNIAVNYGGRDEIIRAVRAAAEAVQNRQLTAKDIDAAVFAGYLDTVGQTDPDLLIRPSGEMRISNFLLWQSAYAEFYFSDKLWPDFGKRDLLAAILDFQGRRRRFGKTQEQISKE
jgi:undecaprenyl diphosphate synthase